MKNGQALFETCCFSTIEEYKENVAYTHTQPWGKTKTGRLRAVRAVVREMVEEEVGCWEEHSNTGCDYEFEMLFKDVVRAITDYIVAEMAKKPEETAVQDEPEKRTARDAELELDKQIAHNLIASLTDDICAALDAAMKQAREELDEMEGEMKEVCVELERLAEWAGETLAEMPVFVVTEKDRQEMGMTA